MKFESFVTFQKQYLNEELLNESYIELEGLKTIQDISNKINYNGIKTTLSDAGKLLKSKVNSSKITTLQTQAKGLIKELEKIIFNLLELKHELKTDIFNKIINMIDRIIKSIIDHSNIEKNVYNSLTTREDING